MWKAEQPLSLSSTTVLDAVVTPSVSAPSPLTQYWRKCVIDFFFFDLKLSIKAIVFALRQTTLLFVWFFSLAI